MRYCVIIFLLGLISLQPISAYEIPHLERAIDNVVREYGREEREDTLRRLLGGVQQTALLDDATRAEFVAVIQEDLSVYQDQDDDVFARVGLRTDTSIGSIPLQEVLSGGPGKDGIPALSDPSFISYTQALGRDYVRAEGEGIVLTASDGSDPRRYPFSILNWHEIVNDTIDGVPVMVTYCPLCGTAIAYDRRIDQTVLEFGVSGLLYQSNLLMYDTTTESLWSQAFGKAKVGTYTDYELKYYPSRIMTAQQFGDVYPTGRVLSDETGYDRDYSVLSPYGDYQESDDIYFPVDKYSSRLDPKTLMVVIEDDRGFSAAFDRNKLLEVGVASVRINDQITLTAFVEEGFLIVVEDGHKILPHFNEMWFSRSARNEGSTYWWSGE